MIATATPSTAHSELDYYRWLGVEAANVAAVVRRVEAGLPFGALERYRRLLGLPSLQRAAELLSIPTRTLYYRKKARRLTPAESDRLLRATRIFGLAVDLFDGDQEAARQWLFSPKWVLGDASPAEYATTEVGAREVEDLIGRAAHGVFS
ncbi:MAG: type II RES/Xre toxin-antitoxin system antitoxin [Thermoanaerobaculia bacterium]